ncbi:sigma factor-like helix-turn-helix DNA-binding protein [Solibacillus silvestris]|uniref:sigma factor-like helix-turn-helix DNA-binding protein n=1 Tax=Solibacillus silvestris TaxID=76853 RepID=UPI003F7E9C9A
MLAELTEKQLTCYLLHVAHTRTFEQIAEELGVKVSTVQTHIERAREKVAAAAKELNKSEKLQHPL